MSDSWVETSKGCVNLYWEPNDEDFVSYAEEDGLKERYPEFSQLDIEELNRLADDGIIKRCLRCELWQRVRAYNDGCDVCKYCDIDRGR